MIEIPFHNWTVYNKFYPNLKAKTIFDDKVVNFYVILVKKQLEQSHFKDFFLENQIVLLFEMFQVIEFRSRNF